MIQLHNVGMSYQAETPALSDINLKIPKGDFVFLTGQSGAGKSTLLKLLYAELAPSSGQVLIDGVNLSRLSRSQIPLLRRSIGVVFQDYKLLPNRTVLENVAITLEVLGWGKRDIGKKVYHILKSMGLEDKVNSTPLRLSGGEQQRVALARAFVNAPKVLFADEPTGNLDQATGGKIIDLIEELNRESGTTVILVTHDEALASRATRILRLADGALVQDTGKAA